MNITSKVIINDEYKPISYPCLGKCPDGSIVLFWNKTSGMVVSPNSVCGLGLGGYNTSWTESWVPFYGTVTLEQKAD